MEIINVMIFDLLRPLDACGAVGFESRLHGWENLNMTSFAI